MDVESLAISGTRIGLAIFSMDVFSHPLLHSWQTARTFFEPECPCLRCVSQVGCVTPEPDTGHLMTPWVCVVLVSRGNISRNQRAKICSLDILISGGWRSQKMQRRRPYRNGTRFVI